MYLCCVLTYKGLPECTVCMCEAGADVACAVRARQGYCVTRDTLIHPAPKYSALPYCNPWKPQEKRNKKILFLFFLLNLAHFSCENTHILITAHVCLCFTP